MDRMVDLLLQHLPLRPSSLDVLTVAGFDRVAEVHDSYRTGGVVILAAELGVSTEEAHSIYSEVINVSSALPSSFPSYIDLHVRTCHNQQQRSHGACATAAELLQMQQRHGISQRCIITFCRALDEILSGGIALGELTEIAGAPGTGKTALATQLAVNAALPNCFGGVAGSTVYIDTEGSFSPERCHCLASHLISHIHAGLKRRQTASTLSHSDSSKADASIGWNVTAEDILANIYVFRAHDVSDLIALLSGALPDLVDRLSSTDNGSSPVRLVVIDSLAFPYRASDGTDFVARTRQLTNTAAQLNQLASKYQLAVVTINQMTTKFSPTLAMENDPSSNNANGGSNSSVPAATLVPALGESWAHAVTTRLILSQGQQQTAPIHRQCTLAKSPRFPTASATFVIVQAGIRGAEYASAKKPRTAN
jgi:RAD51-like protein 2